MKWVLLMSLVFSQMAGSNIKQPVWKTGQRIPIVLENSRFKDFLPVRKSDKKMRPFVYEKTVLLARNTHTLSQQTSSTTKTSRRGRMPVRKTDPIKPQYENCKGKDI